MGFFEDILWFERICREYYEVRYEDFSIIKGFGEN